MPMILYDFNILSIHMKEKKFFLPKAEIEPWTSDSQSNTLTTEPRSLKQFGPFYFEVVSFCSVSCHFQPLMASKVKADLRNELSDLNYMCSNGSHASKCFHELNETGRRRRLIVIH